jgi:putative nucleotidyltransferase with HDIG domain
MKFVSIQNLKPGDILADEILAPDGKTPLLRRGTPLNEATIQSLAKRNFAGAYIESEYTNSIKVEDLIPAKLRNDAINDLKKLDVGGTVNNAKQIVSNILYQLTHREVTLDFIETRSDDNALYQHSIAVAESAVIIARTMGLTDGLDDLATAALLHDIGKLLTDKAIFKRLNIQLPKDYDKYSEEFHPLYGYNISCQFNYLKSTTRNGILLHHINEDGSGYPKLDRAMPKDVYEFAKIIHVADEYDNMRHKNGKNNPTEAYEYLRDNCGTLFNKEIVDTFLKYTPIIPIGTSVVLSNGVNAIVSKHNKDFPTRPSIIITSSGQLAGREVDLTQKELQSLVIIQDDLGNIAENEMPSRGGIRR